MNWTWSRQKNTETEKDKIYTQYWTVILPFFFTMKISFSRYQLKIAKQWPKCVFNSQRTSEMSQPIWQSCLCYLRTSSLLICCQSGFRIKHTHDFCRVIYCHAARNISNCFSLVISIKWMAHWLSPSRVTESFLEHRNKQAEALACVHTVAIGNPERHVRKASHRGSKQQ